MTNFCPEEVDMSRDFSSAPNADDGNRSGRANSYDDWVRLSGRSQGRHFVSRPDSNGRGNTSNDPFLASVLENIALSFAGLFREVMEYEAILGEEIGKQALEQFYLGRIRNSCVQGANLLYRLMILYGKMPIKTELFDLNDVVRSIDPFIVRMDRDDISFEIDMTDEELPALGDVNLIKQAIAELISNAKDALPSGGTIALATRRVGITRSLLEENGGCALLSVVDTGRGIEKAIEPKIFQPFFSTKPKETGAGLGLPVVDRVVRTHNGSMKMLSRRGEGTSVRIYLPLLIRASRHWWERGASHDSGTERGAGTMISQHHKKP